jgi:hypothetical protein
MKRKLVALIVALIPSALIGLAHTNDALANGHGQCSGPNYTYAATPQQVLANWNAEGVTSQVALIEQQTNGFSPMDVTFPRWLNQQDLVAQLAQPAVTYNRGCRNGHVFGGLAPKHLGTGTVVHTVRPLKWAKSDIKGSRPSGPGWKRIVIRVRLIGPADCTNPETAWVYIVVWVKVKTPVKKPTPKPHPKPHPKPKPKPTPTPTFACTGLKSSSNNDNLGLGIAAQYSQRGTKFLSTSVDWGEQGVAVETINGDTRAVHHYAKPGTYHAYATLTFTAGTTPKSETCSVTVTFTPPACTENCGGPPPCVTDCSPHPCTPPNTADVCPNIPGDQPFTPDGKQIDSSGNCVTPPGNPDTGSQPGSTDTTDSSSGDVNSDGGQTGGGEAPDPT